MWVKQQIKNNKPVSETSLTGSIGPDNYFKFYADLREATKFSDNAVRKFCQE